MKFKMFNWVLVTLCLTLFSVNGYAQCFEIESILVDACAVSGPEGKNEMVRFKVGASALNTSNMSVTWPSNTWQGLIQNATTASSVAQLNAEVLTSGGCGTIIEPTGGVLPANATVVLVTSHQFEVTANYFGAITEDIYIIFQNNSTVTAGHFANYNATPGLRALTINLGACSDTVSYDRSLLVDASGNNVSADGATVNFDPAGNATYVNYGCQAPVEVISVDAGGGSTSSVAACQGSTISLNGSGVGVQSVVWSAPSGTFSDATSYTSGYTLDSTVTGSVTLTLTGTGSCSNTVFDTITVNITPTVTPTFSFVTNLCSNGTIPTLPTTSNNGITGTWSPTVITTTGSYTFTPNNASQCSSPVSVSVTVNNAPNAGTDGSVSVCSTGNTVNLFDYLGGTPDTNGTWSPALASGTGVFDPIVDAAGTYTYSINGTGSCAPASANVVVTVSSSITPTFSFATNLCSGGTIPALPTTSDNGITGTWNPAVITSTGSYTFIPNNASQCSSPVSVSVTVNNAPNAGTDGSVSVCSTGNTVNLFDYLGGTPDTNGTWSPALASGTGVFDPIVDAAGTYTYSINGAGSCAPASANVVVTVSSSITPIFSFATNLCSNGSIPALPTTSDNGITGTWNPAVITSTGNYEFTPNDSSQCGASIMVPINVTNAPDAGTNGSASICSTGSAVDLFDYLGGTPDINGTWSPALASGTGVFNPSVDAAGTYIYTVSGTSPCSPASADVVVTVSNPVNAGTNGSASICSTGSAVDLFDYLGGTPDTNGTWSPALTSGTGIFDPSLDVAGTYTYTVNNGSCTPDTAEVIVSVTNIGVPTASVSQPTCANPTGVLEVLTPLDPNYEYSLDGTTFQSSVEFTALEPNSSYYVYVRNTINGCQEVSSITYDVNDLPTAPIVSVTSSCQGVQYVATVFSDKENSTYQWFNASGDVIGSTESVQLTATGDYEVEVTANGCVSTVNFSVNNIYCEIPKGISPNGDDKNDEWDLSGFNVTKVEIFNRYGLKVYSKSGGYTDEWHGQSDNGNDLPTATYYYVVEFSDMPSRTGWVYINRQE